jgi:hypothetical protein
LRNPIPSASRRPGVEFPASESVDDALHTLCQIVHIEVDEEADAFLRDAQVGPHLRQVNRHDVFDTLELDHDGIFDEQVDSIGLR